MVYFGLVEHSYFKENVMNTTSNVIPINRALSRNKVQQPSWIGTFGFYTTIKLLLLVGGLGTAAFGAPSYVLGQPNKFTTVWFIAFIFMFLVCVLERKIRKDFYIQIKHM